MIVLAALVWLPIPLLAVLSVATIVLHHLADGIRAQSFGARRRCGRCCTRSARFRSPAASSSPPYPLVPWFA